MATKSGKYEGKVGRQLLQGMEVKCMREGKVRRKEGKVYEGRKAMLEGKNVELLR